MTSERRAPVRSRRSPHAAAQQALSEGRVIAVTGAGCALTASVVAALQRQGGAGRLVVVGARRGAMVGSTWRIANTQRPDAVPALARAFRDVDVVVHPACALEWVPGEPDPVDEVQAVLAAARSAGVHEVVVVTSARVYGALPSNPVPLGDDAPLRAEPDGAAVSAWLAVERAAAAAGSSPELTVTVVRPASLVGPGLRTVLTAHFAGPRLLVVRGSRPRWQLCHVEDLADAVARIAVRGPTGQVTVACEGWLEQEQVERLSGLARVELPAAVAFATASRLRRLRVLPTAGNDLAYMVHPWAVSSERLRACGWRARYDNVTAFSLLLVEIETQQAADPAAGRLARDATMGAAGAAVAAVGTAALVRAARRSRR